MGRTLNSILDEKGRQVMEYLDWLTNYMAGWGPTYVEIIIALAAIYLSVGVILATVARLFKSFGFKAFVWIVTAACTRLL